MQDGQRFLANSGQHFEQTRAQFKLFLDEIIKCEFPSLRFDVESRQDDRLRFEFAGSRFVLLHRFELAEKLGHPNTSIVDLRRLVEDETSEGDFSLIKVHSFYLAADGGISFFAGPAGAVHHAIPSQSRELFGALLARWKPPEPGMRNVPSGHITG